MGNILGTEAINILNSARVRASDLRDPWMLVSTGFGVGLVPIAPGTFGSAFAVLIWWAVSDHSSDHWRFAFTVLAVPLAWLVLERSCKKRDIKDHPCLVIDEFVGQWLALLYVPARLEGVLLAFLLFRLLDIFKPWPIRWFDRRVSGSLGILLDDVAAGVLALGLVHSVLFFL